MLRSLKIPGALLLALLFFLLAATAHAEGVVRVGLYDFKPLIFKGENDTPSGLFVDMVNQVARKEGWQVTYQYGTWKETYQALLEGRLDIVPCVGVTDARKAQVDFSNEYLFLDWGVIYTRPGSGVENIFDLKGKHISALQGSVYTEGLKQTLKQFDIQATFIEEGSWYEVFRELEIKNADVAISTNLTGLNFEEEFQVRRTAIMFTPVKLAFAVKKGTNGTLIAALDREIGAEKGDQGSYYHDRYEYWVNDLKKAHFSPLVWIAALSLLACLAVVARVAWTSRKEARQKKQQLAQSEQQFRTLIESMLEGVALQELIEDESGKGIDYRFLMVNKSFERLIGLTRKEVVGRTAREVFPDKEPYWLEICAEVVKSGTPAHLEKYRSDLDKHFDIVVYRPQANQFALIVADVTDRKKAQAEIQHKNAELERFTYTVSHDLKSPLITIKSFSGSLARDMAQGRYDRMARDLSRIGSAADKMAGLLDDLLELSRIGRVMSDPEQVDMNELVGEVIAQLDGPLKEKGVEMTVEPGLPVVTCDRRRIHEVWQNLLENGVKYMGEQPRPEMRVGVREQGGTRVFFVRDNGLGIPPKYHQNIFGLFNKLDVKSEGSGIGLALVKRIVEAHGGEVWVESEGVGCGSTFLFHIGQ